MNWGSYLGGYINEASHCFESRLSAHDFGDSHMDSRRQGQCGT